MNGLLEAIAGVASQASGTATILCVVSMLHEPTDRNSATRLFADRPVLANTLARLAGLDQPIAAVILCREEHRNDVSPIAEAAGVTVRSIPAGTIPPSVHAIAAARRWADGWRGGPLGTCDFDLGFHATLVRDVAVEFGAEAVLLIDPSAALLDREMIERVIAQAAEAADQELIFAPVAPGLCGPLLRMSLIERLVKTGTHPGRLVHYHPDLISREVLSTPACVPTPVKPSRTLHTFTVHSDRQARRLERALAGETDLDAEALVDRMNATAAPDALPREVTLELTARRLSRPIFNAATHLAIPRSDLKAEVALKVIDELSGLDDTRLTLAGVGDPMLHPLVFDILAAARAAGLAVNVETDLLRDAESVRRLVQTGVDVVSVHLPAITDETYEAVMGVAGYRTVLENLQVLVTERARLGNGLPVLIPLFIKCRQNWAEMEAWYDQWLRAVGSAAILPAGDCAGQIPDVSVADMAPPMRVPCRRLTSRLTILSDGAIVACEQDVAGKLPLGNAGTKNIADVWRRQMGDVRTVHREGRWQSLPLCGGCKEWHRP
jgi:hypothetical protein